MLHGALLRSPVAAGRIVRIDTAAAAAMPGVRAILTAADVPVVTAGVLIADQPVLARDVVRYAGEPLAAVAADTPAQAARAAQAITVALEPLDVVELETALQARGLHHDRYAGAFEGEHHPNLAWETVLTAGDVELALAEADVVVEHVFHTRASTRRRSSRTARSPASTAAGSSSTRRRRRRSSSGAASPPCSSCA